MIILDSNRIVCLTWTIIDNFLFKLNKRMMDFNLIVLFFLNFALIISIYKAQHDERMVFSEVAQKYVDGFTLNPARWS